ncbi:MAG: hypothetical protein WCO35_01770 [Candidatus Nomurabacteria bacterium]
MGNKKFNFICSHCGQVKKDVVLFENEKFKMIRCSCNEKTTLTREDIFDFSKIKKFVQKGSGVLDIYRYELGLNYSKPIIMPKCNI